LDLRPIWELFSPIFFPPLFEFADPKHADAPFVWRLLRPSLRNYLKKTVHLNEPLDDSYYRDFTPYIVEVQPELKFHLPNTKPRNLDINCRFTADPGVVMLDTPANKPPANILPPFLSVNADGSTSVPYRPTATFVAAAGTGAGKGGVLEIWTRDTDHYLESRWTFPFTLDGTSGFIQPSSSTGGGVPAIRITLEVKFGVVAHSRPGVRRRP
jgi:hypothetical protein